MTEVRGERPVLSAYIITKNEEANIARAVSSVRWMDEVIVLDSGSEDATVTIAEDMGARVVVSDFHGFAEQKNTAMEISTGEWLFNLDADEEMTAELRESIERIIDSENAGEKFTHYRIARRTWYLGRWIEHCGWYPEWRVRFSRRDYARWQGKKLHEFLKGEGETGTLSGDLLHRPYTDLGEHIATVGRYTKLWAQREAEAGKRASIADLAVRPPARFVKMYLVRGGFLDGIPGLIASGMGAFYTFMKYARLYELSKETE